MQEVQRRQPMLGVIGGRARIEPVLVQRVEDVKAGSGRPEPEPTGEPNARRQTRLVHGLRLEQVLRHRHCMNGSADVGLQGWVRCPPPLQRGSSYFRWG